MYGSKHLSNVTLFPLCDETGVMREALSAGVDEESTRPDAIVFAWRLQLPKTIKVHEAAEAVLSVVLRNPRAHWTTNQLAIINELMSLAGRSLTFAEHDKKNAEWWRLVGRSHSSLSRNARAQRKTRTGRVSRDPA